MGSVAVRVVMIKVSGWCMAPRDAHSVCNCM